MGNALFSREPYGNKKVLFTSLICRNYFSSKKKKKKRKTPSLFSISFQVNKDAICVSYDNRLCYVNIYT